MEVLIQHLPNLPAASIAGSDLLPIEDISVPQTKNVTVTDLLSLIPPSAPAGSNQQVQYNNSGAFGGTSNIKITGSREITIDRTVIIAAGTTWGDSFLAMPSGFGTDRGGVYWKDNSSGGFTVDVMIKAAYGAPSGGGSRGGNVYLAAGPAGTGGNPGTIIIGFNPMDSTTYGNVAFFGAGSFGGGINVVFMANANTVPTSNPTGGGILYVDSGALKYRGSSGTVTVLGAA